jgi:anti-sigma factor RsiW
MNCEETRPWLESYADGELDLVRQLAIDTHVNSCPACAAALAGFQARQSALRGSLPRYAAPPSLAATLGAIASPSRPAAARSGARRALSIWSYMGVVAAFGAVLGGGYGWGAAAARRGALTDEAVADHLRSLEPGHLMDVVSSDQHTVKPWFAGKIDFSPPVPDLGAAGFPLLGGRLDQIGHRTAATLVYGRRKHTIDLLIWPAEPRGIFALREQRDGFQIESWSEGGLNFIAVSEVSADDLAQFIRSSRGRAP